MTGYEFLCHMQSTQCTLAERAYKDRWDVAESWTLREMLQENVDFAYALGVLIDCMPDELSGMEI